MDLVANQIGIAMVNAKLHDRLQKRFSFTQAELKRTQEQLLRTERLAALGNLSLGVAHEVRNPVICIGGFAARLKKIHSSDAQSVSYADIILKETERLERMVRDIEQYTSIPLPSIKSIKVSELFKGLLERWDDEGAGFNCKIELSLLPEDPTICVDRSQLIQAIIELLKNSSEAMPRGGITHISTCWEGKYLVIAVKDEGLGIDQEDLPHIFDPFFTKKTRGSGLGLTTVNRIINDHGGEIKVFSKSNAGTEAKLYIPRFSG
jgi:signal transduction histidine kinase